MEKTQGSGGIAAPASLLYTGRALRPELKSSADIPGHVAEWLRSGLQNRLRRFNSGRGLHYPFKQLSAFPKATRERDSGRLSTQSRLAAKTFAAEWPVCRPPANDSELCAL